MKTIVLTGGGTAGHCMPCFALLPDLKKIFDEIYYIGGKDKIENKLAKKYGVTFFDVPSVKFERNLTLKNLLIPVKLLKAISSAKYLLKNLKPSVVFSKGGYVALPVAIAAKKLNIPVISHESDLSIGLANKIAIKFSSAFLTGFERTAKGVKNAEYTGISLDKSLFKKRDKRSLLKKYGLDEKKQTVLVTGGSQGSSAINLAVKETAPALTKKYNLIWLCGKGKKEKIKCKNLYQTEFCDNMGDVYAVADVCVSRAGANTLFELIALRKPTLAIPLPKGNSRGDQEENAEYFCKKGVITVLSECNLNRDSLIKSIEKLFENRNKYSAACEKLDLASANEKVISVISRISET